MEINKINKEFYEIAFIQNGEFGYHENNWKPLIDERQIEEMCGDDEGNYSPATPLGYRDYKESRIQGIKNILDQYPTKKFTNEEAHNIKRGELKMYDKISIDGTPYVVTGDTDEFYYVVNSENKLYSVTYKV